MDRIKKINDHVNPRDLSLGEIMKHNTENDCWVIIRDKVYDLTKFLPDHPGGKKAIMLFAGKDATEESICFTPQMFSRSTCLRM